MNENGIIYKTTNLINGKIYIGQHMKNNSEYLGSGKALKCAIKKYGKENFVRETLEECEFELLNERETYWIIKYNSNNKRIGYNMTASGRVSNFGKFHSDATKLKMSEAKKGNKNHRYGVKLTIDQKSKFTTKGLVRNEKWCNALSESKKGNKNPAYGKPAHNKGIQMSDNAKLKMKEAASNRIKIECIHCGKVCSISQSKVHHGDKCKDKRIT
jgi:group I intron endonuclease